MLRCRPCPGLYHWLLCCISLAEVDLLSRLDSPTVHKVSLQASALRPPCSKFCAHLTGRKHLTLHSWTLVRFICSGDRGWPEERLSGPLDDALWPWILPLLQLKWKIHMKLSKPQRKLWSLQWLKYRVLWYLHQLGSEDLTSRGGPWTGLALPVAVPERLIAVRDLLATHGCTDLWTKEGEVLL